MSRLTPIDPAAAQGRAKDLLEGIEKALGRALSDELDRI